MADRYEISTSTGKRPKTRKSLAYIPSSQKSIHGNSTTDLGALNDIGKEYATQKKLNKARSKSVGPGGLDALQELSGQSNDHSAIKAPFIFPRPILKLTMPPLQKTPALTKTFKGNSHSTHLLSEFDSTENLIDLNSDHSDSKNLGKNYSSSFAELRSGDTRNEALVNLKQQEEQKLSILDQAEKKRQELQNEINLRRDARRKSLANRRVSFAPEATLHTWDLVVEYQDSTTSTNSTSSKNKAQSRPSKSLDSQNTQATSSPRLSTATGYQESTEAPASSKDIKTKCRRSSASSPSKSNNTDDDIFSSPLSENTIDDNTNSNIDEASNSDSDSGEDGTSTSIDSGDYTNISFIQPKLEESYGSSLKPSRDLKQAAYQEGIAGTEFDEDFETIKSETRIGSFAPSLVKDTAYGLKSQDHIKDTDASPLRSINSVSNSENFRDKIDNTATILTNERNKRCQTVNGDAIMNFTRANDKVVETSSPNPRHQNNLLNGRFKLDSFGSSNSKISEDGTMDSGVTLSCKNEGDETNAGKENAKSRTCKSSHSFLSPIRHSTRSMVKQNQSTLSKYRGKLNINTEEENIDITTPLDSIVKTEDQNMDDTMEVTNVYGGIIKTADQNMDDTMEVTNIYGGIIKTADQNMDDTMEVTNVYGGIIKTADQNMDDKMEVTTSDRDINKLKRSNQNSDNQITTGLGSYDIGKKPQTNRVHNSKPECQSYSSQNSFSASINTESPSLGTLHAKGRPRSREMRNQMILKPRQSEKVATPARDLGSPSINVTPLPTNSFKKSYISPSKNLLSSSPWDTSKSEKNLVKRQILQDDWPKTLQYKELQDKETILSMPSLKLTPQPRRSSGIGFDKAGLGSPRVAALLDQRDSICNQARSFVPGELAEASLGARLRDPRIIEKEIDQEVREEAHRNEESLLENGSGESYKNKDITLNLMEMIQSLTPRKKPIKDRKYLHVGGTLRKRPVDIDDDDDEIEGIKRLRNHLGSPVKDVKLQAPPSKNETTSGRIVQAVKKDLEETVIDSTTSKLTIKKKNENLSTSRCQSPQRISSQTGKAYDLSPVKKNSYPGNIESDNDGCKNQRIQLQDFLNMTTIRFLELTTTKRRHTIAPQSNCRNSELEEKQISMEDCVAAGAATIPMLELFQHACHELKRYISEGRKTVREIETETWEENPPLFQEYISASPDLKALMDNQLKNVKTHSRLLSKDLWYDWRMTLHGTLKEGLIKAAEGFNRDEASLNHQQLLLDKILPSSIKIVESLKTEENDLRVAAQEISSCNKEELNQARQRMSLIEEELEAKKLLLAEFRKQFQKLDSEIELKREYKQKLNESIVESEKTREKYKGWTTSEIHAIICRVQSIEKSYGWTIMGVSGSSISMSYQKDIRLTFDASLIHSNTKQSSINEIKIEQIELKCKKSPVLPVNMEFFLKCIQKHLHEAVRMQKNIRGLLDYVSKSWGNARKVARDIHLLTLSYPTELKALSEDSMMIMSTLLIAPLSTKVLLKFNLTANNENTGIEFGITTEANVIYGERLNEVKISEFLSNKCSNEMKEKGKNTASSWGDTVYELRERLVARGRK
ncbi:hypothetical protein Golomagni_00446 [Golovinomyces magnicellulatus]|nr:hypothetical protein Golomagni_00446 [Golovinomyces magnicellulatus]